MFELPCIWEALFIYPMGLAHKPENTSILCAKMTTLGWGKVVVKIMRSIMKSMKCCSIGMVIDGLRKLLDKPKINQRFILGRFKHDLSFLKAQREA